MLARYQMTHGLVLAHAPWVEDRWRLINVPTNKEHEDVYTSQGAHFFSSSSSVLLSEGAQWNVFSTPQSYGCRRQLLWPLLPSNKPLVTHECRSAPDEGPDHSRGEERTRLLYDGTVQGDDAPEGT